MASASKCDVCGKQRKHLVTVWSGAVWCRPCLKTGARENRQMTRAQRG